MENLRGGGGLHAGPRGREGVCGRLGILWGGGAKYFFFGAEMSTKFTMHLVCTLLIGFELIL